jgi:hypothetical protein
MLKEIFILLILSLSIINNSNSYSQYFENIADSIDLQVNYSSTDLWGCGISFYDFNNDGFDDMTFIKENDSIQFYQSVNGVLVKTTSFIYGEGQVKSVIWVDYDNDGFLDLFITAYNGPYRLFKNDGDFNFNDVSSEAGLDFSNSRTQGVSFADINNDGFLDFYVCKYEFGHTEEDTDKLNQLYKNNGDGTFTNITLSSGVGDSIRPSFQSIWFDYDLDGFVDLYVINDRVSFENTLYRNNGDETFIEVTEQAGLEMAAQDPMTITVGDFDNDGDLDIFITNTGQQNKSFLFQNNGDGTFTNVAEQVGVDNDKWSWGATWVDYDNDTWKDLFVATAHPFNNSQQFNNYFYSNVNGDFFEQDNELFVNSMITRSYGVARGDLNNDGYYDIIVQNNLPEQPYIWRNSGGSNNYIKITPNGTVSNKFAIGTWIKVYAGENMYTEYTFCGENYLSQNSQHQLFGLGAITIVDSIEIIYNSGHKDTYYDIATNNHYHFYEGETLTAKVVISDTLICQTTQLYAYSDKNGNVEWQNGEFADSILVSDSGDYYYIWTSPHGIKVFSDTVSVNVVNSPFLSASIQHPSCFESNDGSAELLLFHDTTDLSPQIIWDDGVNGYERSDLETGIYKAYYTDIAGCIDSLIISLQAPHPIETSSIANNAINGNDGSIYVFSFGGTPPYSYTINQADNQPPYLNLSEGWYVIETLDMNNCAISDTIYISSTLQINTSDSLQSIHVFPNPVPHGESITVDCERCVNTKYHIRDMIGKLVDEGRLNAESNNIELNLPKGAYFLSFPKLSSGSIQLMVQ